MSLQIQAHCFLKETCQVIKALDAKYSLLHYSVLFAASYGITFQKLFVFINYCIHTYQTAV